MIFSNFKVDTISLAEEERNENVHSAAASEAAPKGKELPSAHVIQDGVEEVDEILSLLNVCPDDIADSSDEAYESG